MSIDSIRPARRIAQVAPSDGALPGGVCDGLKVGTAGTLVLQFEDGTVETFENVPAMSDWDARIAKVKAATTCGVITALYGS